MYDAPGICEQNAIIAQLRNVFVGHTKTTVVVLMELLICWINIINYQYGVIDQLDQ